MKSFSTVLALAALTVFACSIPVTSWFSPQLGAMLQWTGVGLGLAYLIISRQGRNHSSQETG